VTTQLRSMLRRGVGTRCTDPIKFGSLCGLFGLLAAIFQASTGLSDTVSTLSARGYAVIPAPQKVILRSGDFVIDNRWRVELGGSLSASDVAVESLLEDLKTRFGLSLDAPGRSRGGTRVIRLVLAPKSVEIGTATDRDRHLLAEQAYRLELTPDSIHIKANAGAGLFYGVQTLLQLIKTRDGALWLPEGEITDWPDLQLREIYWDDAHHLDRLEELKRAVRQAAFFKINVFAIKLEGHFQYKSVPAIVNPHALTPAEFQELTDYGLRHHVQVIPYLDGPAHVAFILKHPEYAHLRAFPDSNYEFCVTNPDTYKLYFGMYDELLAANKGVKYFHLSTDEAYYVGLADNDQCREKPRAQELGSVGKLLAEFVTKTGDYLHARGRTAIIWGEYPLVPGDIPSLPKHIVSGLVYGPDFDPLYKQHGIRQMIYTSTQGEEPLFPNYYVLPSSERVHPNDRDYERVTSVVEHIANTPARSQSDLLGVVVAGWADAGLHPETFWLGYATGAAGGWHPGTPDAREAMNSFHPLFYGPSAVKMGRVYQLLSLQAQFWEDSWEYVPSDRRKGLFGDSDNIFSPRRPTRTQAIPLPPVPSLPFLSLEWNWEQQNARRVELAAKHLVQNDELLDLLHTNLQRVEFNRYNLEVFVSVARLCRQNLTMLQGLGRINDLLEGAHNAARRQQFAEAVAGLDEALDTAGNMLRQRNGVLADTAATWHKSWFARVPEANGRRFLHDLDDVKDHPADRTIDLSYLIYRELGLSMDEWFSKVQAARNEYAQAHKLPTRTREFEWKKTPPLVATE
jgi:hexosaminidase